MALSLVFIGLVGCTPVSTGTKSSKLGTAPKNHVSHKPLLEEERERLAHVAHNFVGRSKLKVGKNEFRRDCSGAIRAIFAAARLRLGGIIKNNDDNDVKTIYRYVQKYGHIIKNNPLPGDLVFFHNTYDRSRNGRLNDALTHIGMVEKIEGDIVYFVHHLGQIIIRSRMNLKLPKESFDPKTGKRINHFLRRAQGRHKAFTAAELFAAFGRL
ncbi:MAG TPA: NlpC/P60 family protein [Myxococcota bacterium]|nr:NlpC/P60 family protein [Myxococcota bacterium]